REIVEVEGEPWRCVGVRLLLMRQRNVETDCGRAHLSSATTRGFHRAGAAASCDDMVVIAALGAERAAELRRDAAKFSRFLIPSRLVVWAILANARAAEHHNRGFDPCTL